MKKTIKEKLQTKLNKLIDVTGVSISDTKVSFNDIEIFSYSDAEVSYGKKRVSIKNVDPIYEEEYEVTILLSHENLPLLGTNLLKPPSGPGVVYRILREYTSIRKIIIGSEENELVDGVLEITRDLYLNIVGINREESKDKVVRVRNRTAPFLETALA